MDDTTVLFDKIIAELENGYTKTLQERVKVLVPQMVVLLQGRAGQTLDSQGKKPSLSIVKAWPQFVTQAIRNLWWIESDAWYPLNVYP